MRTVIRRIESIVPSKAEGFGGKARNLAVLARAGFPVPAAYAVHRSACAAFFEHALPEADRPARLLLQPEPPDAARLRRLVDALREAPLPDDIAAGLREAWNSLVRQGAASVAVRSSSPWEDQLDVSGAGIHESVLGVTTEEGLFDAARRCWSSLLSPRAVAYLRTLDAAVEAERHRGALGLVIQALVPADVAGAMFTVNPLTGDPGEMVINAAYGLGTTVTDGRVSPDTLRVDKATGWVRDRVIGEKHLRARLRAPGSPALAAEPAPGGSRSEDASTLVLEAVDADDRARPCLDDAQLETLVDLGRRVEAHFDDARDIEWAAMGGTVYLLQARPVTARSRSARRRPGPWHGRRRGRRRDRSGLVWSNVNVGEALPGVATPLTWSVLSEFSDRGFRSAFGALGCRVPRDAELVASFRGRIYLNLTDFMSIAAQVPGLRPEVLLALGGGDASGPVAQALDRPRASAFLLRAPFAIARQLRESFRLAEKVRRFEQAFSEERQRLSAIDYRLLSGGGLDRVLLRTERLLDTTGQMMLTLYGHLLAGVLGLRALLTASTGPDALRLERELLTGLSDVESATPGLALFHIAEMARAEPAVQAALVERDPSDLRVSELPEGPTRRALERFFRGHGHRGAREAEIASPRWSEDPTLPFATLRAHLRRQSDAINPIDVERRQRAVRDRAVDELEGRLSLPVRLVARHLLAFVQRYTRLRERMRARVVQVLGLYRRVALDASRRLDVLQPGLGPDAAFFLSVSELHAFLRSDVKALGHLIRRRRMQFERDCALPDPPQTFIGFPPPVPASAPKQAADPRTLHGLAASSGVVRARARVLRSPVEASALRPGEILVAPYADVGWSPLFLVAAAVVTDLGGPLSHAAVVAREYGVPTVVNVANATRLIRSGDRLEVDGAAGRVRLLDPDQPGADPQAAGTEPVASAPGRA